MSKFPKGVKRNASQPGYCCINCDASYMNTAIAMKHSCEEYSKRQKKYRHIETLPSPIGGFIKQAKKFKK